MASASILGIGQVSACGAGVEALRRALDGQPPARGSLTYRTGQGTAAFPAFIADPGEWKEVIPARSARRLDAFSRNSLLAASLAVADAGIELDDPARVGVVAATGHGPVRTTFSLLDRMIDRGDDFMSPMEFSISVHNAPAAILSSFFGVQGPCLTVTGFLLAWPQALGLAVDWISSGTVDLVIALAADEVHEVMAYVRSRQGPAEPPFPGETYAAFLLGRHERAGTRGRLTAPRFVQEMDGEDALDTVGHATLWGRNPTCDALSTAAAVLSDVRPITVASPAGRRRPRHHRGGRRVKLLLVYPAWPKLEHQTEFHLPPHGPVVFAAALPPGVEVTFVDENVQEIDFDAEADLVGISMMLTCQVKRGWEIADRFRARGTKVIFGGIATALHAGETRAHADSVFLGEAEGRLDRVIRDLEKGGLREVYDHLEDHPPIESVGTARRDILESDLYSHGGVRMVDLVHASRGCRFDCWPCCVSHLGGRAFRPRPYERVVEEIASIDNKRVFFVDNTMAQDRDWELGLFEAIEPLGMKWICHPLEDCDEVVAAAARAGCWYVYQAIMGVSDTIRDRVARLKRHGIGVEATVLLGWDGHTEDSIKELVDFVMDIGVDMAEFTVLTPFPGSRAWDDLEEQGRILSRDWNDYTADRVVFRPSSMAREKLEELYHRAWESFYADEPQRFKMYKLLRKAL